MPPGYHGCYLRIDLSVGRAERVSLSDTVLRQYLGGSGLGAALLLEEGAAAADPVSPEAPLVFAFSPLVGFMAQADYRRVLDEMHLANGLAWTIPITLAVTPRETEGLHAGDEVALLAPLGTELEDPKDDGGKQAACRVMAADAKAAAAAALDYAVTTAGEPHPPAA